MRKKSILPKIMFSLMSLLMVNVPSFASEASLVVPNIKADMTSYNLLLIGLAVSIIGVIFGFVEFLKVKKLDVHAAMANVGNTIFETCKTYLVQQGKFLIVLEVLIALCIAFYFGYLEKMTLTNVLIILGW